MAFGFSVVLYLWLVATSSSSTNEQLQLPDGVSNMECRDRYFMTAVDLSFTGRDPQFHAVDETGAFPIVGRYAAECGYTVTVLPLQNRVELRASYFSCHTHNKNEKMFTFSFYLVATHGQKMGQEVTYTLTKTCSPSLPWSPREVTCEENYMEVSVRSDVTCGLKTDFWSTTVQSAYRSASVWMVRFQKAGQKATTMDLEDARAQGYVFYVAHGRIVFRTPYGQPDSDSTTVNDVPVEVVQATLFSTQSWVVLMVDLIVACSMHEGSYEDRGYVTWETPETPFPELKVKQISVGLGGELMEQPVAENRGYVIKKHNDTVRISIPYNAEGRDRTSVVIGDLLEFFIFRLHFEQISVDKDNVETRLRLHRTSTTGLLRHPVVTDNRTVVEDRIFTVYLGDVPEDVRLAAFELNGQQFTAPFTNTSTCEVVEEVHPDTTHGFTLKVSFDDPCVIQQVSTDDAAVRYQLDVNYTLTVVPEDEPFYHVASFVAVGTDLTPLTFRAVCSETAIVFRLDRWPLDPRWEVVVGSDPLTSDLADRYGYVMSDDGDGLLLEAPLFTQGYEYENVTLEGFYGTFEIRVRDRETSNVQSSTVKTCPFTAKELIVCSTDGMMTVVADLSLAPRGGIPARTNLLDKHCGPRETDHTRALFSFPVNSCGSVVKVSHGHVTYENRILFDPEFLPVSTNTSADIDRVTIQCSYPIAGLHRLFSAFRFEADTTVVGQISHSAKFKNEPERTTVQPTTVFQTPPPAASQPTGLFAARAARHPPVRYVRVLSSLHNTAKKRQADPEIPLHLILE